MSRFWAKEHKMETFLHIQDWEKCNALICLRNLLIWWQDSHVTCLSHAAEVQVLGMVWGISQRHMREHGGRYLQLGYYQWNMPSGKVQCNTNTSSWGSGNSILSGPSSEREVVKPLCEYVRLWHSSRQHGLGWVCRTERGNPCLSGHRG